MKKFKTSDKFSLTCFQSLFVYENVIKFQLHKKILIKNHFFLLNTRVSLHFSLFSLHDKFLRISLSSGSPNRFRMKNGFFLRENSLKFKAFIFLSCSELSSKCFVFWVINFHSTLLISKNCFSLFLLLFLVTDSLGPSSG